jgi:hypothetical protein
MGAKYHVRFLFAIGWGRAGGTPGLYFPLEGSGRRCRTRRSVVCVSQRQDVRIYLAVLFPERMNAWMLEENTHASIPRSPNLPVNIAGPVEEVLLRTQVEVLENVFPVRQETAEPLRVAQIKSRLVRRSEHRSEH